MATAKKSVFRLRAGSYKKKKAFLSQKAVSEIMGKLKAKYTDKIPAAVYEKLETYTKEIKTPKGIPTGPITNMVSGMRNTQGSPDYNEFCIKAYALLLDAQYYLSSGPAHRVRRAAKKKAAKKSAKKR
jgi:hypothetical protein